MKRALKVFVQHLGREKFSATERPRDPRPSSNPRNIPADVQRAVWARDGGRCTFTAADGRRCESRKFIEFDHDLEVARGGEATVDNIRLRCRAHNQYTAEQTYGAEFMQGKRESAKKQIAERRSTAKRSEARAVARPREMSREEREQDIARRATAEERALQEFPWLREMKHRRDEDRQPPSSG